MSKLPKLTADQIAALSHDELGDALVARDWAKEAIPAKKVDRITALTCYEPEGDDNQSQAAPTDEQKDADRRASLTQAQRDVEDAASGQKKGQQNGTGKSIGAKSTAPEKPAAMERPYLDSPRPFGIHISGANKDMHLVRFKHGRTPINDAFAKGFVGLTASDILKALKTDSYVADNGAEVVE